jgi:hypothetical protein
MWWVEPYNEMEKSSRSPHPTSENYITGYSVTNAQQVRLFHASSTIFSDQLILKVLLQTREECTLYPEGSKVCAFPPHHLLYKFFPTVIGKG